MKRPLSILAGLALALAAGSARAEAYNYCAIPGAKTTVLFIDRTSAFDKKDEQVLVEGISSLVSKLSPGDRLVIRTIADDHAASDQVFNRCKPGCPKLTLRQELLGTCSDLVARRENLDFLRRLAAALRGILGEKKQYRASAILETIASSLSNFDGKVGQVVLYSDMIENSRIARFGTLSERAVDPLLARLRKLALVPKLPGAQVAAFGFGRTDFGPRRGLTAAQSQAIKAFWRKYFAAARAAHFSITERMSAE
ncbi:MAG: hypothetical protein KIT16_06215 [Rhodospirillaceae bacterium]|nr:hypothetical protein [Rhodospirillaceae bacterium]